MTAEPIYVKKDSYVLVNTNLDFIYQVYVFCYMKNYFSILNTEFYKSRKEIPKVVNSFFVNPHTEIRAELYSAPLSWLLDNNYVRYVKPDKIIKNKVKSDQNGKPKTTTRKSSRR